MASQVPFAQYGLEEAVEQFIVQQFEILMSQYSGQQSDGASVTTVEVASLFTKLQEPNYPFIGVRAYMPEINPEMIGDLWMQAQFDPNVLINTQTVGTLDDCEINIHIESKVYREIQRLSSYITMNIEKGWDAVNNQPYLATLQNFGIISHGWRQTPVTRKIQDSLQREGDDRNIRTDIETLFQRDLYLKCNVALQIQYVPGPPIMFIDYSQTITVVIQIPV